MAVQGSGWTDFDVGRYDVHEIADAQDYSGIVNHMRSLDDRIAAWMRDHPGAEVIAHLEFWTRPALTNELMGILGKARDHARSLEQFQVVRERDGIARVRELAEHFLVGKNLAGISATKVEQLS